MADPSALAHEITDAYTKGVIIPAPSSRDGGIDIVTAYAVEAEIARARRAGYCSATRAGHADRENLGT